MSVGDFLLSLLTFGKWRRIKVVYESANQLFDKFGNAESITKKLSSMDSFFQENATLKEQLNGLKKNLSDWNKFESVSKVESELSNIERIKEDLKFKEQTLNKAQEQLDLLKEELNNWARFGSVAKVEEQLELLSQVKEELTTLKSSVGLKNYQLSNLEKELNNWSKFESVSKLELNIQRINDELKNKSEELVQAKEKLELLEQTKEKLNLKEYELENLQKELDKWAKFESISKVEWQLENLRRVQADLEFKEQELRYFKEQIALIGGKESIEKIHRLIQENDGIEALSLKLKNYWDMCREVSEIAPEKNIRDLINDWKSRLRLKGLSKNSTDIGVSMGKEVERMLRESFSNVPNFSWEKEKHIIETGKRIDFFFEFRHRKGLFGKVVLENKNGKQWSPKDWKAQITEYVSSTDSFCGILFIPKRQEGLEEVEKATTAENRNFPIFSFDNIEDLKKFLTLILWLSASYTPPREISDEIDLKLSTDDMHEAILRTCGTICKNYLDFLGEFEAWEKRINTIFNNSNIFKKKFLKLREKILSNKMAVEEELDLMQQYGKDKKLSLPETIPELLTEVEDEEE